MIAGAFLVNFRYSWKVSVRETDYQNGFFWGLFAPRMRYRTRCDDKRRDGAMALNRISLHSAETSRHLLKILPKQLKSLFRRSFSKVIDSNQTTHFGSERTNHEPSGTRDLRAGTAVSSTRQYGTLVYSQVSQGTHEVCLHPDLQIGDCWTCGTAICEVRCSIFQPGSLGFGVWLIKPQACKTSVKIQNPRTDRHLRHCQPLCSKCFYQEHCKDHLCKNFWYPRHCICKDLTQMAQSQVHSICQRCEKLDLDLSLVLREQRDVAEIKRAVENGLYCSNDHCEKPLLGPGPLWWRCSGCRLECRSQYHIHWQTKSEERS